MTMNKHKLNVTRPDFFMHSITDCGKRSLDVTDIENYTRDKQRAMYIAYTVLMESNLDKNDYDYINNDGESVVVRLTNKKLGKEIKDNYHNDTIRYGNAVYDISVKVSGQYITIGNEFQRGLDVITNFIDELEEEEE